VHNGFHTAREHGGQRGAVAGGDRERAGFSAVDTARAPSATAGDGQGASHRRGTTCDRCVRQSLAPGRRGSIGRDGLMCPINGRQRSVSGRLAFVGGRRRSVRRKIAPVGGRQRSVRKKIAPVGGRRRSVYVSTAGVGGRAPRTAGWTGMSGADTAWLAIMTAAVARRPARIGARMGGVSSDRAGSAAGRATSTAAGARSRIVRGWSAADDPRWPSASAEPWPGTTRGAARTDVPCARARAPRPCRAAGAPCQAWDP
jgi:hypothetical protein